MPARRLRGEDPADRMRQCLKMQKRKKISSSPFQKVTPKRVECILYSVLLSSEYRNRKALPENGWFLCSPSVELRDLGRYLQAVQVQVDVV